MAIKRYKPTSPGRRFMTVSMFDEITCGTPEKACWRSRKRPVVETQRAN